MMDRFLLLLSALLGLIMREAYNIIPAIKDDDNGTPAKFSFRYYFDQTKNQMRLVLNVCGGGILLIGHEGVMNVAKNVPMVSEYLGDGTQNIMAGAIGFFGGWIAQKAAGWMDKKTTEE